jgi:cell division protease FtsH
MGYSGAELEKLVNEAALKAAREDKRKVEMSDFRYAQDIVTMGAPRDEKMDRREKELTAWHEAGHAILAWAQEGVDPVHKVSIVPRGRTLGVTQLMPESEIHNLWRTTAQSTHRHDHGRSRRKNDLQRILRGCSGRHRTGHQHRPPHGRSLGHV